MKGRILVVDDEGTIRRAIVKFLTTLDYEAIGAENPEVAIALLTEKPIDLALVDLVMPNMDGVQLIREIKKIRPETVAIVMTAFGTITSAVEAMRVGAYHYLTKPFELDDIASLIETALEHKTLREENRILKQQLHQKYHFDNIIGESDAIKSVFELVRKVADTDSTILILGESGTGKERVANAIHHNSRRRDRPLITVNCAAIPEGLLEAELFGHVKGAFTGAIQTRNGRFDSAHTGTIFLDEIGEMSPGLQVKLLRVLQERRFEPVGSTKTHEVDVRIIAATNKDLEKDVELGKFREDLYYRLNVIPVKVPPLRDRNGDIDILLNHFLKIFNEENGRHIHGFSPDSLKLLKQYPWPGNVRELENMVERLVVLKGEGLIEVSDLSLLSDGHMSGTRGVKAEVLDIPEEGVSFRKLVSNFEDSLIIKALEKTGWNKNKAAALLKLNRTTLVEKIKKKQLEKPAMS